MVDFAEESETITTILSIYLAEYHGKGPADSAAGGAKTKADEAAVYGTTIETAYDLYVFLNAHYKQVQTFIFILHLTTEVRLLFTSPVHRLLKRTMKLCTKFTVASSIIFRKELSLVFLVETLLLSLQLRKIIALVLDTLAFRNLLNKYFNVKLSALVRVVFQVRQN